MSDHGPENVPLLTYAYIVGIALLGGVASFVRKVRSGSAKPWNIMEFVGELVVSAFAGIITYFICAASQIDPYLTAAFVGISGHMGSRAIFLIENILTQKLAVQKTPVAGDVPSQGQFNG